MIRIFFFHMYIQTFWKWTLQLNHNCCYSTTISQWWIFKVKSRELWEGLNNFWRFTKIILFFVKTHNVFFLYELVNNYLKYKHYSLNYIFIGADDDLKPNWWWWWWWRQWWCWWLLLWLLDMAVSTRVYNCISKLNVLNERFQTFKCWNWF